MWNKHQKFCTFLKWSLLVFFPFDSQNVVSYGFEKWIKAICSVVFRRFFLFRRVLLVVINNWTTNVIRHITYKEVWNSSLEPYIFRSFFESQWHFLGPTVSLKHNCNHFYVTINDQGLSWFRKQYASLYHLIYHSLYHLFLKLPGVGRKELVRVIN